MIDELPTLSAQVAELLRRGGLDIFDPAYDVALAAIAVGYGGLRKAQRQLFDRAVAPALAGSSPLVAPRSSETSQPVALPRATPTTWRPIREAPDAEAIEIAVSVGGKPSALNFPCRKAGTKWVNATNGKPVYVKPTHWREWPEGTPSDSSP